MSILIYIDDVSTRISENIPKDIKDEISGVLSYAVEGYMFSPKFKAGFWNGRKKLLISNKFPTGLLSYVKVVLDKYNLDYAFIDNRNYVPINSEPLPMYGVSLRDYQMDAVDKAIVRQRGLIHIATGGGKTLTSAGIISKINRQTIFVVHTESLAMQTRKKFQDTFKIPIGLIGCGENTVKHITVAMMQSLVNDQHDEVLNNSPVLVVDEAHHASCDSLVEINKRSKAFYRYGLSATLWREDGSDLLLEAFSGPKIVSISASDLIKRGILSKPYIYFINVPKIEGPANQSYQSIYQRGVIDNDSRNEIICHIANYLVSMGKSVLMSVSRISHGDNLLRIMESKYPHVTTMFIQGESGSEVKTDTLKQLNEKSVNVCIATSVFSEGVDVPTLDCLINCRAQKSSLDFFQLVGRTLRLNSSKKVSLVIDFFDQTKYLRAHASARIKISSAEPEFVVKQVSELSEIEIPE